MIEKEEFIRAVESAFQFLSELGFSRPAVSHDKAGVYEYTTIKYRNEHITIKIDVGWHYRDSFLSMGLYPRSRLAVPVQVRDGFGIQELAEARAPDVKIPSKAGHEELLRSYADILNRYGRDILQGDFRAFPPTREAAKKNIARAEPDRMPQETPKPVRRTLKVEPPQAPVSPDVKDPGVRSIPRTKAVTPRSQWIIIGANVILAAAIFVTSAPRAIEEHRRDLRLISNGRPLAGIAMEAHAGVSRYGVPAWTEVRIDVEPYAAKKFAVRGVIPAGTTVTMLCLDEEARCAGADDVRRRLREWPLVHGFVVSALVLVVPTSFLLGAWWIDRRKATKCSSREKSKVERT